MWLALVLAYFLAFRLEWFPVSGAYDFSLQPEWSWEFARSFLSHWFLPFLTLFLVAFGGWAIGMRNLIIYELEAEYANYLQALGAPSKLVRKYAYGNAVLPQMSGLALALGAVVGGALVTEIVFGYPGMGSLIITAIQNRDYFLLQGLFLFIIIGVLIANFLVDIAYVIVDPRTRTGIQGSVVSTADQHTETVGTGSASIAVVVDETLPPRRRRSETLYFAFRNRKLVIGLSVVLVLPRARDRRAVADGRRPVRVRLSDRAAAVVRALARDDRGRAGRVRAVRLRLAVELRRRRCGERRGGHDRHGDRVRRRLPRRRRRRHAEHAHERRARDPDARGADHRRRVPQRRQPLLAKRC